jgi:hypothetical protein
VWTAKEAAPPGTLELRLSKRQAALALAQQGFHVFPLKDDCTPAYKGWQASASTELDRVRAMWTDATGNELDHNIGIATGTPFRGKYLNAFDIDVKAGKQGDKSLALLEAIYDTLPVTRETTTGSGGRHLFFLNDAPLANSVQKIGEGIDVRGRGGYVVGPGSVKAGRRYIATSEIEPVACPQWLADMAGAAKEKPDLKPDPNFEWDTSEGLSRAEHYLKHEAPEAVEGDAGDQTTYNVLCRVREFGVAPDTALLLALEHYNDRCAPPWDPEDLQRKVANAYEYAENVPGKALATFEFGAVDLPESKSPPKRGLYVVRWHESKPKLDQPYLIDDVCDLGTMVVTYGDSNVGKTYVVLDQARCIAAGEPWNGHKVKQGLVVYVASEGGTGFHKRIEAYRREHKLVDLPFSLIPCPVDIHSPNGDTDRLIRLIKQEQEHFGQQCVLIVIDTLARAMGGGDENTSVDMGLLVRQCDRLRAATGATVNLIHHTGKDKTKGARGSSALRAATDTEIEIDAGVLSVEKQRDLAKVKPMNFRLKPITIGQRPDGRDVTSCVVEWLAAADFEINLSPEAQQMLDILRRLVAEKRDAIEADPKYDKSDMAKSLKNIRVPWAEWSASVRTEMKGKRGSPIRRQRLFELRPELSASGLIERDGRDQWFIPEKEDSPD